MAKLTTTDLTSLTNQESVVTKVNANNALIETAIENTLSRDGTTPNTMESDLDLNSNNLLNVGDIEAATGTIAGFDISLGFLSGTPKGAWVTATAYVVGDIVSKDTFTYIANTAHTSGVFVTDDQVNGYWTILDSQADKIATPETFNGDGSDTTFVLAVQPSTENHILVFIDGVKQKHDSFSLGASNKTITFSTAPPSGTANIEVWYIAGNSTGTTGATGSGPQVRYTFDSSTSMADPGAGDFRFNNATVASVTNVAFDATSADSGNPDVSDWIDTWDASTSTTVKGHLYFQKRGTPSTYAVFYVDGASAVTDNTGWLQVQIAHVDSNGTWTAADEADVSFVRTGDLGTTGSTGPTGAKGDAGGFLMAWESTTTDTDQGAGKVWLNNGTASSATVFYMDDVEAGGTSINSFIDSWDDATNLDLRGTIYVFKNAAPANFHVFNVTGVVTSASTYSKVAVAHVVSSGTISDADAVSVAFFRTGDKGTPGGQQFKWDTDTADSDQGVGTVWGNHGTIGSISIIYLDDVDDAGGADMNAWIDAFDDSTSTINGQLTLTKQTDLGAFALFNITGGVTSASTYSKIAVTYVTGTGTFSADDKISVTFTRQGDKGTTGATGTLSGGIPMEWDEVTTDSDQGVGKVWVNHATESSATVLYMDDVDTGSTNINTFVDSWDNSAPSTIRGSIMVSLNSDPTKYHLYNVTGAVTSASTYSKIGVAHVISSGTGDLTDGGGVSVYFIRAGDAGSGLANVVDDTTPQLGGFLDTNSKFISSSQGANIASVAGDTNIWTNFDGNTVHITGTNAITDFGTPKSAGDSMWLIFDAAASVVDSATITCVGNTNFQAAANDLAFVYALSTSTFLFIPFPNDGLPLVTTTVAKGGTGATSLTDGGVLLGSGTSAITAMSVLGDGSIIVGDNSGDPVTLAAFSSSTGTLAVSAGGTGAATLTDGGVLLGSGTGAVTAMSVLSDGSIVVGDGSTDPVALAAFSSSTGNLVGAKGGTIGQQTIWVPAGAMEAAASTAPATSNVVEIGTSLFAARTMDFATGADDFCYFGIQMPKSWDAGALILQYVWSATGTTANTVMWSAAAVCLADNEVLTTAFPSATPLGSADTNSTTADDLMISAEISITVASTPTAEQYVMFEISRTVASDTLAEDARLHGIRIHYTVNTGIDT
jgi:hypothetical protein